MLKKFKRFISSVIAMSILVSSLNATTSYAVENVEVVSNDFTSSTENITDTAKNGATIEESLIYGSLPHPLRSAFYKNGTEINAFTNNDLTAWVTDGKPDASKSDIGGLPDWAFMNGESADSGFANDFNGTTYNSNGDTYATITYYLKGLYDVDEIWVYGSEPWGALGAYELYVSKDSATLYNSENCVTKFVNESNHTRQKFYLNTAKQGSYFGIKIFSSIPYNAYDNVKQYCHVRIAEMAVFGNKVENDFSPVSAVDFSDVLITDDFWAGRQLQGLMVSLPACIEQLEKAGAINNFRYTIAKNNGGTYGVDYFDYLSNFASDSDVYKVVEGICYAIQNYKDSKDPEVLTMLDSITKTMNEWIDLFLAAQDDNGYLNTIYVLGSSMFNITAGEEYRFQNQGMHELYCAGHFYEMAVAHYYATGETRLLDAAVKNADMVYKCFYEKSDDAPYIPGYVVDGHPEVELALVKLSAAVYEAYEDVNKVDEYLTLCRYFAENYRLHKNNFVTEEAKTIQGIYAEEAWGHCVRFFYYSSALADLNILDGSETYYTLKSRWDNVQTKTYITGGMGLDGYQEGFGDSYDLDNEKSYCETCASISSTLFSKRMNLLYDDAKYFDSIETQIYNNIISGIGLDGDTFYYENRLTNAGGVTRPEWYLLPCCPSNLMRYIQSLGGYIYTKTEDTATVNLYIGNNTTMVLNGVSTKLSLSANMPWSGNAKLTVEPENTTNFTIKLRIPSWATGDNTILVNGTEVNSTPAKNGYVYITRTWSAGDEITINFPMETVVIDDSDKIATNKNQLAVRRGPVVYTAEQLDNEADINSVTISKDSVFEEKQIVFATSRQGTTNTYGTHSVITLSTEATLYDSLGMDSGETATLNMIPFYTWANREKTPMRVYIASSISTVEGSRELDKFVTASASYHFVIATQEDLPEYVNDGSTTKKERWTTYHSEAFPEQSTDAWIEYTFVGDCFAKIESCNIWWFDDGGGVQLPDSMEILYWNGNEYVSVTPTSDYTFTKNEFNTYIFEPVITNKIRLHVTSETKKRGMGILEWDLNGKIVLDVPDEGEDDNTSDEEDYPGYDVDIDVSDKPTFVAGDISDDKKVNLEDVSLFARYLAGWNVSVNEKAIDVNGDKKVNLNDLVLLAQYVAGWDVSLS